MMSLVTRSGDTHAYRSKLRESGVRIFRGNRADCASDAAACKVIAPKLGCWRGSLRDCYHQADRDNGGSIRLTGGDKDRVKKVEREVPDLSETNEIVKNASAYFALAKSNRPAPIMTQPRSEKPHDRI